MIRYYIQRIKNVYHLLQAVIANMYFGWPSTNITVIGITGTDGKTTTTLLLYHVLKKLNKKVSVISTNFAEIAGKRYETGFHVTTPESWTVQAYIQKAVEHNDEFFILETTSHGLDQYRVWGTNFDIGIVTNITHEHLYDHLTFEHYLKTKAKLILASKQGVLNYDDDSFFPLSQYLDTKQLTNPYVTFGKDENSDFNENMSELLNMQLTHYNESNYKAVFTVIQLLGLNRNDSLQAMKSFKMPTGRLETVHNTLFKVIIDFAHTPNSLTQVLSSIKAVQKKGRIIHVFGAAAKRDNQKRILMGKESATFADLVILTEEDYRTEDPHNICDQIAEGLYSKQFTHVSPEVFGKNLKEFTILIDRQKAINKAIRIAKPGDTVILTGKGHEKSLCRETKEYPWSEHEAVKVALSKKKNTN